jgi:MprA protease rhombosortase-interaction domain-containing protein
MRPTHEIGTAIRRHSNGSIDIDAYRADLTARRGHALHDAHALRMITAGALVMAGVLGFAIVLPSALH